MKRVIGPINTSDDLKQLQKEADLYGVTAVGFAASRAVYKQVDNKPVKITNAAAAKILDVTEETIEKIIEAKGVYEFEEETPSEEQLHEEIIQEEEVTHEQKVEEVHEEPGPEEKPEVQSEPEEIHKEVQEQHESETKEVTLEITLETAIEFLKNNEEFQKELDDKIAAVDAFKEFLLKFKK